MHCAYIHVPSYINTACICRIVYTLTRERCMRMQSAGGDDRLIENKACGPPGVHHVHRNTIEISRSEHLTDRRESISYDRYSRSSEYLEWESSMIIDRSSPRSSEQMSVKRSLLGGFRGPGTSSIGQLYMHMGGPD